MPAKQNTKTEPDIVVWEPIPGTSQEFALDTRCHHTLYTGARGPGKTDTQLMRFRRRVGMGYGAFWRGIIFDREYKNLDDLVNKSKRWFYRFNDGARFLESSSAYKWVWPSGEELLFRAADNEESYWDFHGQEYPYIGFNELTKYPTSEVYDMMQSLNRSSFTEKDWPKDSKGNPIPLPDIPLECFSTCNPYGAGHGWVKRRFIDVAPYGSVVKREIEVFNPRTQKKEKVVRTQVAIFGSYRENIYLDPIYVATLESETDENRRKAWLLGDWDIVAGGAFDDVWNKATHILPRFIIPKTWRVDRSFDWGSTHPFSVGWWAEANGEEAIIINGDGSVRRFCPPPGTFVQLYEWYGTKEIGTNKGLKLSAKEIAEGIKEIEASLLKDGWIPHKPHAGPADNQIRDVRESDVDTIEKKMADCGIRWLESDKSPGSRRNGLDLMRERLKAAKTGEGVALYFMQNCLASISTIPTLPRDPKKPDDIDTTAEDHPYDMARYRVLRGSNRLATSLNVTFPT